MGRPPGTRRSQKPIARSKSPRGGAETKGAAWGPAFRWRFVDCFPSRTCEQLDLRALDGLDRVAQPTILRRPLPDGCKAIAMMRRGSQALQSVEMVRRPIAFIVIQAEFRKNFTPPN